MNQLLEQEIGTKEEILAASLLVKDQAMWGVELPNEKAVNTIEY